MSFDIVIILAAILFCLMLTIAVRVFLDDYNRLGEPEEDS